MRSIAPDFYVWAVAFHTAVWVVSLWTPAAIPTATTLLSGVLSHDLKTVRFVKVANA
jgi:hypothetical protein